MKELTRRLCAVVFDRLDFVYLPSRDVAADVTHFTGGLGGELVFAIEAFGTRVAMVRLTAGGPQLLLAGHLAGDRPILVFRVDHLDAAIAELEGRGVALGSHFEMPYGVGIEVSSPGPQRLALYERTRPERGDGLAGRTDFGAAARQPTGDRRRQKAGMSTQDSRSVSHSYDPADGFPRVMPSLHYEDVGVALAWLADAFGLEEHLRWTDADGVVRHAEMRVGGAFVELSAASEEHRTPKALGGASGALVVLVDDVDAHLAHARARGAQIVSEPVDRPWGLRQYTAEDPDGHRWEFSQFLRHVPPQEWGATLSASR